MGTANEDLWKGVSDLPNYSSTFPKWPSKELGEVCNGLIDKDGIDLLASMLIYEPNNRIDMKRALKHHYFDDLNKSALPAGDWDGDLIL